ncbi:hypothetical protein CLU83_2212 [Flavobacterium sp. 1]|uniref:hypothetical protein n=1 Tax=Flavobacterium sp. 1 TaxID=2035200 RepID=UPI000C241DDE|nr:hypothetical protein [Flavobacterium sp. 1]PJJ08905.1 hypothetical protein CLU83_2212 [Flavobacterium sp. 1]
MIDKKLLELRRISRKHGKYVMNKLFDDYLAGPISKKVILSCTFCGAESNITKEHILPKWVFESNSKHSFKSDVNELDQPYIKATIPLCGKCNSDLFNSVEREVQKILREVDLKRRYYSPEEWELIIRWLEIIDFKFQVWDISTKFKAHKKAGYLAALADISIAFMRNASIRKVTSKARSSLKRISVKDKSQKHKCLIVGKTKIKTFHYFHTSGEFIYLEVPTYNKGFFYFYEREFKNDSATKREAMKIIKFAYNL